MDIYVYTNTFFHLEMERIQSKHAGNERKRGQEVSNKQGQTPSSLTLQRTGSAMLTGQIT